MGIVTRIMHQMALNCPVTLHDKTKHTRLSIFLFLFSNKKIVIKFHQTSHGNKTTDKKRREEAADTTRRFSTCSVYSHTVTERHAFSRYPSYACIVFHGFCFYTTFFYFWFTAIHYFIVDSMLSAL